MSHIQQERFPRMSQHWSLGGHIQQEKIRPLPSNHTITPSLHTLDLRVSQSWVRADENKVVASAKHGQTTKHLAVLYSAISYNTIAWFFGCTALHSGLCLLWRHCLHYRILQNTMQHNPD